MGHSWQGKARLSRVVKVNYGKKHCSRHYYWIFLKAKKVSKRTPAEREQEEDSQSPTFPARHLPHLLHCVCCRVLVAGTLPLLGPWRRSRCRRGDQTGLYPSESQLTLLKCCRLTIREDIIRKEIIFSEV